MNQAALLRSCRACGHQARTAQPLIPGTLWKGQLSLAQAISRP
jgi:hypothetical protein